MEGVVAYYEPPFWHQPVRQFLGAVPLGAGQGAAAEATYHENLRRNRGNGWSLRGLGQALRAQNRAAEAVDQRFQASWTHADLKPVSSRTPR